MDIYLYYIIDYVKEIIVLLIFI